jgi:sporulation protein YlmC with PRC-barrel domain
MTSLTTFYLSKIIGVNIQDGDGFELGKLTDVIIDFPQLKDNVKQSIRPVVIGIQLKNIDGELINFLVSDFTVIKTSDKYNVRCEIEDEIPDYELQKHYFLSQNIVNKQVVDMNGKKIVRVSDVRLVSLNSNTFVIAVEVGMEGFLRKLGIAKYINWIYKLFKRNFSSEFILWDDVETVDFSNYNIKLSKNYSRLQTLHPSDLADIIEDLDKNQGTAVFSSLDEEKAADVLEELEVRAQIKIIENLPLEKAADVLEKMPANEAADIIEELKDDKAELLLNEMQKEASEDIRELLEYSDNVVGSLMTTDFLAFNKSNTVNDVLELFRQQKPDVELLYNIFITGNNNKLVATVSIRDILISDLNTPLHSIMNTNPIFLYDNEKIDKLAEIVSKYNLLAIPVTNKNKILIGMVIIDDIIEDLINDRRTNKK